MSPAARWTRSGAAARHQPVCRPATTRGAAARDSPARWGERGSATVWVVALTALVLLAGEAALARAAGVIARHRAESAADLAALAAAGRAAAGGRLPCRVATDIAARNGASLRDCRLTGPVALVVVEVTVRLGPLGTRRARARARAGPVGTPVGRGPPTPRPGRAGTAPWYFRDRRRRGP